MTNKKKSCVHGWEDIILSKEGEKIKEMGITEKKRNRWRSHYCLKAGGGCLELRWKSWVMKKGSLSSEMGWGGRVDEGKL